MKTHYRKGCRFAISPYFKTNKTIITDDLTKVTCGLCLQIIKEYYLVPRSEFSKIPTFQAKLSDSGKQLSFTCPVCGRRNVHGSISGHHSSHCGCWEKG
ncbi:MAG: hypothetical protein DRH24_18230, partial [Deltaproteobacteria bacterium]